MEELVKCVRQGLCLLIELTAVLLFMSVILSVLLNDPFNMAASIKGFFVALDGHGFVGLISMVVVFGIYFWLKKPE